MRFIFFIAVFFMMSVLPVDGQEKNIDIQALENAVKEMVERYPQATLQDIYKNNFQDYFGPAHIMAKREYVIAYLKSELEEMRLEEAKGELYLGSYYDPCGWRHNYYQVSLRVVSEGKMSLEEFADAFMAGGGAEPLVTLEWMQEWELLKGAVKKLIPDMGGFNKDDEKISQLIKEGKYVVHHSNQYVEAYKPHYRIMKREIFEKLILPKIR